VYANIPKSEEKRIETLLVPSISEKGFSTCAHMPTSCISSG
jgi:hypothetical protein